MLGDVLDALAAQTRPLDDIVVVDNASTDDTPRLIATREDVTDVVTMTRNYGGAGGFAAGIARALARGADLVWIMDDDTVPAPDALEALLAARAAYPGTPALLAARADWTDGREHPMNVPRYRAGLCRAQRRHAAAIGARPIRTASFVAVLLDARAIREDGLPLAAYFLWNDDFEYTGRLLRRRVGLYVPRARVEHRTAAFGNSTADPGARFVNEVRNKIWTFTRSRAFGPVERAAYMGKTLLRWGALLARSPQRGELVRHLVTGVRESLNPVPATSEVLADTAVAADVRAIEEARP
ncbi:glycosyltransferase [Nanchangia anserum]|uniref:Glycosyltransferase n=2 Tax=Nanchangia anserum TaxID=2692125 RepID=A0A8I0GAD5_9ACTO|nr:glycosyltransferase [Nanchangia anserum]MBD3690089.1 glycosyltransferase [Nanchangia anserum]QOX82554.1 glycosyltransferase [Nanchangia anserum]